MTLNIFMYNASACMRRIKFEFSTIALHAIIAQTRNNKRRTVAIFSANKASVPPAMDQFGNDIYKAEKIMFARCLVFFFFHSPPI